MGISGLLPMLKSIQRPCNLKKFNGLTLGVDAYGWLHRGAIASAIDMALDRPTTKFLDFAMHRVRMLIHHGITPYIVFDGDYLPSKAGTESDRAERRRKSKTAGLALYHKGNTTQAHAELQKAVDITPEMAGQLIRELQKHNVKYVVAPYEADAQLAYMERKGIIEGIISEDSDLLVFGCRRLLTKLDQYGDCIEINRDQFAACKGVSLVGWSDVEFRRMAILSGCDYLDNINGLGLKTAYRLLRKFKTAERVVQRLQFESKYSVPATYLEDFRKAELTFLHQWVFCPIERKLVMNTEPQGIPPSELEFLGKDIDAAIAIGVANGRLHPTTKDPLILPAASRAANRPSPWGSNVPRQPSTPMDAKIGKPIDTFFKPRRVPLAELDPNSFSPSPSQQRLQETGNRTWLSSPVVGTPVLPTPTAAVPVSAAAERTHRRISSQPVQTTSKRQRLCGDDSGEEGAANGELKDNVKSKFFPGGPSVGRLKRSRTKKTDNINIWSDDSIDGAMADLSDLSEPRPSKVMIFHDGAVDSSKRAALSVATESSSLTISSETSISTAATSLSFEKQSSQASKSSLFDRFALHTSQDSDIGPTATALKASKKEFKVPRGSISAMRRSQPPQTVGCAPAHVEEIPSQSDKQEEQSYEGVVPDSPLGERGVDSPAAPQVPRSPDRGHRTPGVGGSEDCLVPQSEDDEEDDEGGPAPVKLDLGRFRFRG